MSSDSVWETYAELAHYKRCGRIVRVTILLMLFILGAVAYRALGPKVMPDDNAGPYPPLPPVAENRARDGKTNKESLPMRSGSVLLPDWPRESSVSGINPNKDNVINAAPRYLRTSPPQFPRVTDQVTSGPVRIKINNGEELVVGTAVYAKRNETGAAGEWRIAPWWQPGWIPESADCGEIGNSIIAAHVSWYKRPGPFQYLGALKQGDVVDCLSAHGVWHTYAVVEVFRVAYTDVETYWGAPADSDSRLTLYTCTPEVDGIIVVRAHLTRTEQEN